MVRDDLCQLADKMRMWNLAGDSKRQKYPKVTSTGKNIYFHEWYFLSSLIHFLPSHARRNSPKLGKIQSLIKPIWAEMTHAATAELFRLEASYKMALCSKPSSSHKLYSFCRQMKRSHPESERTPHSTVTVLHLSVIFLFSFLKYMSKQPRSE